MHLFLHIEDRPCILALKTNSTSWAKSVTRITVNRF